MTVRRTLPQRERSLVGVTAVPLSVMFLIAEMICRVWDRRRGISEETAGEFAVDLDDGK